MYCKMRSPFFGRCWVCLLLLLLKSASKTGKYLCKLTQEKEHALNLFIKIKSQESLLLTFPFVLLSSRRHTFKETEKRNHAS